MAIRNGPLPALAWSPACMEPDEWASWQDTNSRMQGKGKAARPCADCTLGFAAEMRTEGRCNGTPAGVEHDEIQEERAMEHPADGASVQRRVEVAGELPCATCSHAPVCALRPALEAVRHVLVLLPRLDPALGLELAATATCGHYERVGKSRGNRAKRSPAQIAAAIRTTAIMRERKAAKAVDGAEAAG